jgi:hypothetical protein
VASQPRQRAESDWIGLGDASRALGVNESTLRRWADAGLVRTFRTPGGHRRFASADLRRLVDEAGADGQSFNEDEFDAEAMQRIRSGLANDSDATRVWMSRILPEARSEMASMGRQTVALVERYLAAADADRPALESMESDAAGLGDRYGTLLQASGVGLSDAVLAFAYFRRGMDDAVRSYAQKQALSAGAAGGLWQRASVLEDRLLLNLTTVYEVDPATSGEASQPTGAGS